MTAIKQWIKRRPLGLYLTERYKKRVYEARSRRMDDRRFIEWLFQKRNGVKPNLDVPQSFSEKLQWLKLHYRDPQIVRCSDKLELKSYLREQGFEELAVPTADIFDSVNEVEPDSLPVRCILKATHGSGWHIKIDGDARRQWKRMRRVMKVWLSESLYIFGREWNYKHLTPRLIVEPMLSDGDLTDYKFFCFGGTVRAVQVNQQHANGMTVDFYDTAWQRMPNVRTAGYPNAEAAMDPPPCLEEMKAVAAKLSAPFPFVRVDMYCVDGRMYVGEMTFFPSSGFHAIEPPAYEKQFGNWLSLPNIE